MYIVSYLIKFSNAYSLLLIFGFPPLLVFGVSNHINHIKCNPVYVSDLD